MKLLKMFFYILLSLIILAIAIPVLLMIWVNPNQFKPQIQKEVQKVLHRSFEINGNLHWTVYPSAGIKAEDIAVGDNLLDIKSMEFTVALQPLLHKDIRIGKIVIDGMKINLIKKANGQSNWDATSTDDDAAVKNQAKSTSDSKPTKAAVFSVSEFKIKNSQVTYTDQATNKYFKLSNYTFNATQINVDQAFPVEISTVVTSESLAGASTINAHAKLKLSLEKNKLNVSDIYATVNDDFVLTGNKTVEFTNPIRWQININLANIKIDHLLKLFKQNKLDISGTGTVSANLSGSMAMDSVSGNLKFEVDKLHISRS